MPKFLGKPHDSSVKKCTVRLLEDVEVLECEFQVSHKGKYLIDHVFKELNLIEKDYFGLRYVDEEKQRHWLDPAKSIMKQVKEMDPVLLSFRVKFYPPNPFQLKERITQYQIYLQVRRDLLHGRLYCTTDEAALLGGYILQAELGDFNPEEHIGNYASEFKILLKQSVMIEERMIQVHQEEANGLTVEEAEDGFLRKACTLETYGVDPHPVKDQKGNQLYLGVNYNGIMTYAGGRKTNHMHWNEVRKINYEGRMFIIHLMFNDKKTTVGFKCPTGAACRYLWRCSIEVMLFFTSFSSSNVPRVVSGGSFFSWGSKFKYTGRVEREVLEETAQLLREQPPINRISSLRRKACSVPATPSTPLANDLGHNASKLNHSDARLHLTFNDHSSAQFNMENNGLETVTEVSENLTHPLPKMRDLSNGTALIMANEPETTDNDVHDGRGESMNDLKLRYSHETLHHSSSESQITGRTSRSVTPILRTTTISGVCAGGGTVNVQNSGSHDPQISKYYDENPSTKYNNIKKLIKLLITPLLIMLLILSIVAIVTFETDFESLSSVRRTPEMIIARRTYYEPVKEYAKDKLNKWFLYRH